MRDLNFFENYIKKKKFKINKRIMYFIVSIYAILFLIATAIYNEIIIRQDIKMVENLRITAEEPKTLKKVQDIKSKEVELSQFRESVEKIKLFDKTIEEKDIVDEILLEKITDNIPKKLFLTSLSIQGKDIYIVGIAKDKLSVGEFQKGLQSLDNYEEIFISSISKQENYYKFSLNIMLRGGEEDGKPIEENQD